MPKFTVPSTLRRVSTGALAAIAALVMTLAVSMGTASASPGAAGCGAFAGPGGVGAGCFVQHGNRFPHHVHRPPHVVRPPVHHPPTIVVPPHHGGQVGIPAHHQWRPAPPPGTWVWNEQRNAWVPPAPPPGGPNEEWHWNGWHWQFIRIA